MGFVSSADVDKVLLISVSCVHVSVVSWLVRRGLADWSRMVSPSCLVVG